MKQEQFLLVLDRDEAELRWHAALDLDRLGAQPVALASAQVMVNAASSMSLGSATPHFPPFT